MNRTSSRLAGFGVTAMLLCAACAVDTEQPRNSPDPPSPEASTAAASQSGETIRGTELLALELGNQHRVRFFQFADGQTGVYEVMPVDVKDKAVTPDMKDPKDLASVFSAIRPGEDVPEVLVRADVRAAEFRAQQGPIPVPARAETGVPQSQALSVGTTCSGDYYHDQYGCVWFNERACNQGNFRECKCNLGYNNNHGDGYAPVTSSSWVRLAVMAADFDVGAQMTGGHYYKECSCPWGCFACASSILSTTDFSVPILQRHIQSFTFTGGGSYWVSANGNQPCPRIHTAFSWN